MFPAAELASVTVGINWPLEALRHILAAPVARRSHRFCSHSAAAAGAADEENLI
jgi:hypothetical protein